MYSLVHTTKMYPQLNLAPHHEDVRGTGDITP